MSTETVTLAPEASIPASRSSLDGRADSQLELDRVETSSSVLSISSVTSPEKVEKRVSEWQSAFDVEDEELVDTHGCALSKDILVHGRIYISNRSVAFKASILGYKTRAHFPLSSVTSVLPKMTALVIPNGLEIVADNVTYTFASLPKRDATLDLLTAVWRDQAPEAYAAFLGRQDDIEKEVAASFRGRSKSVSSVASAPLPGASRYADSRSSKKDSIEEGSAGEGSHPATQAKTDEFSEVALDVRFPTTPEKIFNLVWKNNDFIRSLWDLEKFTEVDISEWAGNKRSFEYVKPLNGPVGPSSTKCFFTDKVTKEDSESWYEVITTTKTPDVPSGGSFSVKTKTVITWAGGAKGGAKVRATSEVEWTGRSMLKSVINSSAIQGQKDYNKALSQAIRAYIKSHSEEFGSPGETGAGADVDDEIASVSEELTTDSSASASLSPDSLVDVLMADPIRTAMGVALLLLLLWNLMGWIRGGQSHSGGLSKRSVFTSEEARSAMERLERMEREWRELKAGLLKLGQDRF